MSPLIEQQTLCIHGSGTLIDFIAEIEQCVIISVEYYLIGPPTQRVESRQLPATANSLEINAKMMAG